MKGSPLSVLARIPTLVLAAGHGAKDPGAVNEGHEEAAQAITIVNHMEELLRPALGNALVIAPHSEDTHDSIRWINARYPAGTAWAVEVHRNAGIRPGHPAASGQCGLYHADHRNSSSVAEYCRELLVQYGAHPSTWARNQRSSRHKNGIGFINQPHVLSHILELGFMEGSNTEAHLQDLALIAAQALCHLFTGKALPAAA